MNRPTKQQRLLISGSCHPELGELVAKRLSSTLVPCISKKMANGETHVDVDSSVRGRDVYIVQSVGDNVNDALFELQLMAYACKTAAAHSIIGVIPYLPYSRQCKMRKRGSIVAKLMAQNLSKSGFCHIITLDLHQKEIQGFFECPVDNLRASPYLLRELSSIRKYKSDNLVVVSRNPGIAKRAQSFAERLRVKLAVIHGEGFYNDEDQDDGRSSPPPADVEVEVVEGAEVDGESSVGVGGNTILNEKNKNIFIDPTEDISLRENVLRKRVNSDACDNRPIAMRRTRTTSGCTQPTIRTRTTSSTLIDYLDMPMLITKSKPQLHVVGEVVGKSCIIVEDMLSETRPFIECANLLKKEGALHVIVMVTHGIFYGDSVDLINQSQIDHVIVTNSVNFDKKQSTKIRVVDISFLLSEAIRRIHHGESMSFLFQDVPIED
jgi:ribose-phosphate pyrophosphokinase